MTEIYIAGVGTTRFGPQPEESFKSLCAQSIHQCLEDAGAKATQVGAVYFANVAQGVIEAQLGTGGQQALQGTGLEGLPVFNIENGGASAATAFCLARNHLLSGQAELVLAVGTEKMTFSDVGLSERALTIFKRAGYVDNKISGRESLRVLELVDEHTDHNVIRSRCSDLHTLLRRSHMLRFGTSQQQLDIIASKNHANFLLSSMCHRKQSLSVDKTPDPHALLSPLTTSYYPALSDGSAAALLGTAKALKRLKGHSKAIRVDSCILTSGNSRNWNDFENHVVSRAASSAYAQAGIGPEDVDIAEIHDVTAFGELFMTELLGFCKMGDGGYLAESGATMLNGRIPVNPSGGLQFNGHPIGATGLRQIYELVNQLRQTAGPHQVDYAKVAVQQSLGGILGIEEGSAVVTVLSR